MFEIRFHGRGGQGTVTAAEILGLAAFLEGKEVQFFPDFGGERRGAPVRAFCRINDKPINIHSNIYQPDCVIVLDELLIKSANAVSGLKKNGWFIINSSKKPEDFACFLDTEANQQIAVVDATAIALSKKLGSEKAPIVNTAILGAIIRATGIVRLESTIEAIMKKIEQKKESNTAACAEALLKTKIFPLIEPLVEESLKKEVKK